MFLICCLLPFHQCNKFNQRRALPLGTRLPPNLHAPDPRNMIFCCCCCFFLTQEGYGKDDREKYNKNKIQYFFHQEKFLDERSDYRFLNIYLSQISE